MRGKQEGGQGGAICHGEPVEGKLCNRGDCQPGITIGGSKTGFWLPCSPISPDVPDVHGIFFSFSALLSKQNLFRMSRGCQKDKKAERLKD